MKVKLYFKSKFSDKRPIDEIMLQKYNIAGQIFNYSWEIAHCMLDT